MAMWISLAVLSLAVVSTLSFPHPDNEYKIPTVGLGSRAQYYVLHSDGAYKYGYDSGDGLFEQSMAKIPGEVTGAFGYRDPTGTDIKLEYTADNRGFIATGAHLPVAPAVNQASTRSSAPSSAPVYSAPSFPTPATSSLPVEIANIRSSASADGSYSFGYETSSSSRDEAANAENSVNGKYTFVADDGINREIKYIAGSETGYIAEGDSLPVGPSVPGAESGIPTGRIFPILSEEEANALAAETSGSVHVVAQPAQLAIIRSSVISHSDTDSSDASYSFSYDAEDSDRQETADANLNIKGSYSFVPPEGHRLTVNYIAGSETGFVATGDHLPVAPEPIPPTSHIASNRATYSSPVVSSQTALATSPVSGDATVVTKSRSQDASYSFNYDAGESSRSETADANLNVEGSYSFIPPEGQRLTVNYIAGSETGFVATGNHLPVAPTSDSTSHTAKIYSAPSPPLPLVPSTPVEVAQIKSSANGDGSYSFAYDTSSSSRAESADASNTVTGHYAFIADDGINREIKYIAGSETGYIAEGNSLPVGPAVPGAESGIPTGRILPVLSEEEANALARASSSSGSTPTLKTAAPIETVNVPADASYNFDFSSDSYSRNEKSDAEGNIIGSYTYVDEDGNEHEVKYVAGRETGFLPEGYPVPTPISPENTDTSQVRLVAPSYSSKPAVKSALPKPVSTGSSSSGHSSQIIGDVLLHQYDAVNSDKYGYVYTHISR